MPSYATGPGHPHSRGAVFEAYVDTDALNIPCPACGVPEGEFCRHTPDVGGKERRMPCPKRITAANRGGQE